MRMKSHDDRTIKDGSLALGSNILSIYGLGHRRLLSGSTILSFYPRAGRALSKYRMPHPNANTAAYTWLRQRRIISSIHHLLKMGNELVHHVLVFVCKHTLAGSQLEVTIIRLINSFLQVNSQSYYERTVWGMANIRSGSE